MLILEQAHRAKKSIIRFYRDYFTTEGKYTSLLPDSIYIRKQYRQKTGNHLNLRHPQSFNEKLNWMKLHDRKPIYTQMVDKYLARNYISEKVGDQYLVPLIGVWDDPEQIDFDSLPNCFVLKCNHDNGVIICRDKSILDTEKVKEELRERLSRNYYKKNREWPYKNVNRRIICEKYLTDNTSVDTITDYKFFCFDGDVDSVMVSLNQNGSTLSYFFSRDWKLEVLNERSVGLPETFTAPKPDHLDEMFRIASKLSEGVPHLRVDMYNSNGVILVGELTLCHGGGYKTSLLPIAQERFGDKIHLW